MLRAATLCVFLAYPSPCQEPPHHLVQVRIRDAQSFQKLLSLDLDLAACTALVAPQKVVDVIATDRDLEDKLAGSGLDYEVAIKNLERHHARELAKGQGLPGPLALNPPLGQGSMGGHYTLSEVVAMLDAFAASYPAICAPKVSLGKSIENRDLWMVKISDHVFQKENEAEVYFDGAHHAREPLSVSTTLMFMDWLLSSYGTDPEATFLVNNRELYFVPVVNPDGYEYNRTTNPGGGGMWRKNRRQNTGGSYGVDLNRNYLTGWSAPNGGNSTSPTSDIYRGTAPSSEPEVQAIDSFVGAHKFVVTFSTHTYTDILLRPFGYQVADPPNVAEYNLIGAPAVAQNGLQQGQGATLLYIAAGCAIDHHHVAHGAYSWTAELGKSSEGGFWPNSAATVSIATRHQHMFKTMAKLGGAVLSVPNVAITEAPGGNSNGKVEPGEGGQVVVSVANGGAAAAYSDVTATLTSLTPGVAITNGTHPFGKPARFSTVANGSTPLTFAVPASFAGPVVRLLLSVGGDGLVDTRELRIVYGSFRRVADDDFEKDRGFSRASVGTATTGLWERGAPQQTTLGASVVQPGVQHTPGGTQCLVTDARAGLTADDYDVDGGYTDVVSPRLDLAHLAVARIDLWRWYTETAATNPDAFAIDVSNDDGGNWVPLLSSAASTSAWVNFVQEIPIALTDRMRLRIRAQDGSASLVEALVDDLTIEALAEDASLVLLSSGTLTTHARLCMSGQPNAQAVLLASAGTANIVVPGSAGVLLLDPATLIALPTLPLAAGGYAVAEAQIPNDPGLRGGSIYWQMLQVNGSSLTLGNRQRLRIQ